MNKRLRKKKEKVQIDDCWFPRRAGNLVIVDAYYVPAKGAKAYILEREYYAEKIQEVFQEFCTKVYRDWKGSQDGEAVLGLNAEGDLIAVMHLDPSGIAEMKEAHRQGCLREALLECSGLK